MKDDQACMQGVTQERVYEFVTNDKIDDLLEEVLKGIACGKEDKVKNWDDFEWEKRVVNNVKLSDLVFSREQVDVVGAIVHRTPQTEMKDKLLLKLFEELKIQYAGALPEDTILQSVQVQDVAKKLGAELLYPVEDMEVVMSTKIT